MNLLEAYLEYLITDNLDKTQDPEEYAYPRCFEYEGKTYDVEILFTEFQDELV